MLTVSSQICIPDEELQFSFVRSSGPGGQNVNKVNSKAILRWSVWQARGVSDGVRQRFLEQYRSRITVDGEIVISSQQFRDQGRNQQDCIEKLRAMLVSVASPPKRRKRTKPTKSSVARRREKKQAHSLKKQSRQRPSAGD
jgi:ribosome-associated protein